MIVDQNMVYGYWRTSKNSAIVAISTDEFLQATSKGIGVKWGGVPIARVPRVWEQPIESAAATSPGAMIKAGKSLVCCNGDQLRFLNAHDGQLQRLIQLRSSIVPEGIAAGRQGLFLVTEDGSVEGHFGR